MKKIRIMLILFLFLLVFSSISTALLEQAPFWKLINGWLTYTGNIQVVGNLTVDGETISIRDTNVSGDMYVNGSITGDSFIGDGSLLTNIPASAVDDVWVNETFEIGNQTFAQTEDGEDVELRLETDVNENAYLYYMESDSGILGFRAWYDGSGGGKYKIDAIDGAGVIIPKMEIDRDDNDVDFFVNEDLNDNNITNVKCIELNGNTICDWGSVNVSDTTVANETARVDLIIGTYIPGNVTQIMADLENSTIIRYYNDSWVRKNQVYWNDTNIDVLNTTTDYLNVKNPPPECSSSSFVSFWNGSNSICVAQSYNSSQDMINAVGDNWVDESGDTMTGSLNMGENNITNLTRISLVDGSFLGHGHNETLSGLDISLVFYNNLEISGGEVSHAFIEASKIVRTLQVGLPFAAGYMRNSQIIGEDFNETNATMIGFCDSYWDTRNSKLGKTSPLNIDCDSDANTGNGTGADLLVEDDIKIGGTLFADEGFEGKELFLFDGMGNEFDIIDSAIHIIDPRIENVTFDAGEIEDIEEFTGGLDTFSSSTWDEIEDTTYCNSDNICVFSSAGVRDEMNKTYNFVNNTGINVSFYYAVKKFDSNDNLSFIIYNGSENQLIWNYTGTSNIDVSSTNQFINISSEFWNKTLIVRFQCTTTNPSEDCYIDDVNFTSFDPVSSTREIERFDATIYFGDKNCYIDMMDGVRQNMTISCDDIILLGNVTQTSVTVQSENVTGDVSAGSFTLDGVTILNWQSIGNLTEFKINGSQVRDKVANATYADDTSLLDGQIGSYYLDDTDTNCTIDNDCPLITYDSELAYINNCSVDLSCPLVTYDNELAYISNCSVTDSCSNILYTNNANFVTLTDNSMADTLHRHSELSASDGTPDQALYVDASGDVGIGTTTPGTPLTVQGVNGNNAISLLNTAGTAVAYMWSDASAGGVFSLQNSSGATGVKFEVDGDDSYILNGNVGIGTTSPTQSLHVQGNLNVTGNVYVGGCIVYNATGSSKTLGVCV